jgi:hypothetical protein
MERIEPRYVTFGQAKLLKEKGFDVKCSRYYEYALKSRKNKEDGYSGPFGWKKGELNLQVDTFINGGYMDVSNESWYLCAVPEQWQVVEWLDKIHNTYIHVQKHTRNGLRCYSPFIDNEPVKKDAFFNDFDSPQEAYSAAIDYILKELI